ncbi:hypothetical protein RF11_02082 [Thelohanellus kitauei]|uniref:Uncharacterized protein n=1 Tax=Thelohanellus kitauei TaxID=669202 RepID=A0A0C2MXS7_THEKT|nr:hypothetical protein RF11_02082 [Thelohanellus kitauei]
MLTRSVVKIRMNIAHKAIPRERTLKKLPIERLLVWSHRLGDQRKVCAGLASMSLALPYYLEVFKPAPVHFCTDFTSTASATVSTYGRVVLRLGTFLQAVKVVQDSHLLNTHPHPQPTRATLPSRHSFA